MTGLTAGELAGMRSTVQGETLAGTAVLARYTAVSDGQGGQTYTYSNFGTVGCHISPVSGDEEPLAARIAAETVWVVTLPAGTNVNSKDRVTSGGTVYEVDIVRAPRTWELARRCLAHTTS